ncbi:unnamed protein product [Acanthoscelides obtectus]|uniref:Uncharacterized protein n=1 Tax=Acanthoscelides obtectus TaxID=200917 RepID=A0A9P0PVF5_ACAOB|nr:unnamed protein product [Acanthoscelides obtectus]CAK1638449.1 hypothetical protein AOBTE_LOCUS10611 [Acanthoscelides obtectus]
MRNAIDAVRTKRTTFIRRQFPVGQVSWEKIQSKRSSFFGR